MRKIWLWGAKTPSARWLRSTCASRRLPQGDEAASAEKTRALAVFSPSAGFDVAVLDIMLPGMNGFPVCRRRRPSEDSASIGIIMLSAKTWRRTRSKASPSARTII